MYYLGLGIYEGIQSSVFEKKLFFFQKFLFINISNSRHYNGVSNTQPAGQGQNDSSYSNRDLNKWTIRLF